MDEVDGWRLMVPATYDALWTAALALGVLLTGTALVVWALRRTSRTRALLDLLLIVVVPVLGPVAYLVGEVAAVRRGRRSSGADAGAAA